MNLFESLMEENKRISKSERRIRQLEESSWMLRANKSGYSFKDLARKYENETGISIYDDNANVKEFLRWVEKLLGDDNLVPTYEGKKLKETYGSHRKFYHVTNIRYDIIPEDMIVTGKVNEEDFDSEDECMAACWDEISKITAFLPKEMELEIRVDENDDEDDILEKIDIAIGEETGWLTEYFDYTDIDAEAERALNARETEYGADGTRAFRDETNRPWSDMMGESKRKVKESNNQVDISEYEYVSTMQNGSDNYSLYRKIDADGKGHWVAWKQKMGDNVGDPFEITYRQAQGFDLIDDSGINKLSRDLGKLLLPREGRR